MQFIRPLQKTAKRQIAPTQSLSRNAATLERDRTPPSVSSAQRNISSAALVGDGSGSMPTIVQRPVRGPEESRNVLHVGCGAYSSSRLHALFKQDDWKEVRCDVDRATNPDIVTSIVDMRPFVADQSCDAIWASHVLEHLSRQQVSRALSEFRRVLAPTGFALIRCPDVETIAQFILDGRIADVIYTSAAGPITPLDMLYGHDASIARGNESMRHGTAFTENLLGQDLLGAGFPEVRTTRTATYEVWAAAFMDEANVEDLLDRFIQSGIDFRC